MVKKLGSPRGGNDIFRGLERSLYAHPIENRANLLRREVYQGAFTRRCERGGGSGSDTRLNLEKCYWVRERGKKGKKQLLRDK